MTKINQAIKRGKVVDYADLFSSYSKKRRQEILKRAKYLSNHQIHPKTPRHHRVCVIA